MSQPIHALSIHSPAVREAAKAVASLYSSTMLSRREINDLIGACKDGNDIDYSPQMIPFATGTHYSRGLVHSGRRIACADELHKVLLSFPLHPSLPVLRKKINTAFCNIPPEAIIAWHATITQDLSTTKAGAAVVGASTLHDRDASNVAPVEGAAVEPASQADTESAAVPPSGSSSGLADDDVHAVSELSPIDAGVIGAGDVVSSRVNDASENGSTALVSEVPSSQIQGADTLDAVISKISPGPIEDIVDAIPDASLAGVGVGGGIVAPTTTTTSDASAAKVIEAASGLPDQAKNTDHLRIQVAEADGSRPVSITNATVILPLDSAPSPSCALPSKAVTTVVREARQVDDGSLDVSGSSKDTRVLGKRALPTNDDADVASDVPPQASPKRQRRNWWPRSWF